MTPNELEQKISEIEKRSPIRLDRFFNCAKSDLRFLSLTELDQVEAVVGYSNSGRMGSSLYCVSKEGKLVYKGWPLSSPLKERELHPLKDNLLTPVIGVGFFGGIAALGTHDIEWIAYFAGLGAIGGALASVSCYFKDAAIKRRYEAYIQRRTEE